MTSEAPKWKKATLSNAAFTYLEIKRIRKFLLILKIFAYSDYQKMIYISFSLLNLYFIFFLQINKKPWIQI